MMLVMIKHARPLVDPARPGHQWRLSEQGRADAGRLAEALRTRGIARVYSSDEPKARETADVLAGALGVPVMVADDLHEHDRSNVPHMRSGEFISHMELFFRRRSERVLGLESADECLHRFATAVGALETGSAGETVAVVSHGTVIALYLASLGAGKPFELWRRMGLPSYAVIDPSAAIGVQIVDKLP